MNDKAQDIPLGLSVRRHILGVLGLGFIVAWQVLYWGYEDNQSQTIASVCMRVGLTLSAIWLAFPQALGIITKFSKPLNFALLLGGIILAFRPQMFILVGPVVAVLAGMEFVKWLFTPPERKKKKS